MTRKDTILVAVIINAGLLAVLFATAIIYDTDKVLDQSEISSSLTDIRNLPGSETKQPLIAAASTMGDEVDNVLKDYQHYSSRQTMHEAHSDVFINEPSIDHRMAAEEIEPDHMTPVVISHFNSYADGFVEISVKRGDTLDKIARTNGTTIYAIKNANQLKTERLSIGQLLKIPVKKEGAPLHTAVQTPLKTTKKELESAEPFYYSVKSGDNPSKIAKQFGVKTEDIIRLNLLDDEKARNLKAGDRIRVK